MVKAKRSNTTSRARGSLIGNARKNKMKMKPGDIVLAFSLPAHGNGKLKVVMGGMHPMQFENVLLAIQDGLAVPDHRLDEYIALVIARREAEEALADSAIPANRRSNSSSPRACSKRARQRARRRRQLASRSGKEQGGEEESGEEHGGEGESGEDEGEEDEGEEKEEEQGEEGAGQEEVEQQQQVQDDPSAALAAAAAAADETEAQQWQEEHGPEVEAAVGRVLQRLGPGATFEDLCTGVEAATGVEYMPDAEVFQPFKKAIRRGLNALFADVTSAAKQQINECVSNALDQQPDMDIQALYKHTAAMLPQHNVSLAPVFRGAVRAAARGWKKAADMQQEVPAVASSLTAATLLASGTREPAAAPAAAADTSSRIQQPEATGRQRRAAAAGVAAAVVAEGDDEDSSPAEKRAPKRRKVAPSKQSSAAATAEDLLQLPVPNKKSKRQQAMIKVLQESKTWDVERLSKSDPFVAILEELDDASTGQEDLQLVWEDVMFAFKLARNGYLTGKRGREARMLQATLNMLDKFAPYKC